MVFQELLERMDIIFLEKEELKQVFSVDSSGHLATLGDFMAQNAPPQVQAAFGITPESVSPQVKENGAVRSVCTLDEHELIPIVEAYLDTMPHDETLEIIGQGSFTVDQLRQEVEKHSPIGERLIEIIRHHNMFVEEAVKKGKIRPAAEDDQVKLPDFDF